jgi:hypothetical protein
MSRATLTQYYSALRDSLLRLILKVSPINDRQSSAMVRWIQMKVKQPKTLYVNILAVLFTWLKGFVVLPVTITSVYNFNAFNKLGRAVKLVMRTIENPPLLWIAGLGAIGLSWLWWK